MRHFLNLLAVCVLALSALTAHAAEKRVALVIGNSAYPTSRLDNPKNDATAMAAAFRRLGFEVDLVIDATKTDFDAAQKRFAAKADKAEAAVLFYAGHGMQANNHNYLVPIDAKPQSERDLKREMIKLDDIIDDMGAARVKLVFFDACRDNPLARSFSRGGARGMAAPAETSGTLISFATKHGNTATDGETRHSPYTEALLAALENPTDEVHALLRKKVQEAVKKKTGGQQEPWAYGSLNGDFYLIQGPVNVTVNNGSDLAAIELGYWNGALQANSEDAYQSYLAKYPKGQFADLARASLAKLKKAAEAKLEPPKPAAPDPAQVELAFWDSIKASTDKADFEEYLRQWPSGHFAGIARNRLKNLNTESERSTQTQWKETESRKRQEDKREDAHLAEEPRRKRESIAAKAQSTSTPAPEKSAPIAITSQISVAQETRSSDKRDCPEMVVIPAGKYVRGDNTSNYFDEKPEQPVRISKPFMLCKTEVTLGQWRAVMGYEPYFASRECGDDCPVSGLSWKNAQDFIKKLNEQTKKSYRLPSEAEWEYACRSGERHRYCGNDDIDVVGWHSGNSKRLLHPVGSKQPNSWGLYDMSGNVAEFVEDCYHADYDLAPDDGSAWTSRNCSLWVLRGGSSDLEPLYARAASRLRDDSAIVVYGEKFFGLRLARMFP